MAFKAAPYEVEIYVACLIVGSLPQSGLQSACLDPPRRSMECNYRSPTYAEINDLRAIAQSVKIGHTFQEPAPQAPQFVKHKEKFIYFDKSFFG